MIRISSFLIFFLFATMVGWLIDSAYRSIVDRRWVNAGYFIGPFCPIYGFGGLLLLLMVALTSDMPFLIRCVIYFLGLSCVELIGGIFTTNVLKVRLWDYSDAALNIMGHIDLLHSTYWLTLALLFEETVWPIIEFLNTTATEVARWVDIVVFFTALTAMSFALVMKMIKERSRVKPFKPEMAPQPLQDRLEELNGRYERLLAELDREIVSPSERSVKRWLGRNEHYLEDINTGVTELRNEIKKLQNITPLVRMDRDLGNISRKVEKNQKRLRELRKREWSRLEDRSEVRALTSELDRLRGRVKGSLERSSRSLRWRSYILTRGRSFHPLSFLDRFPAWQVGWEERREDLGILLRKR